VVTLEQLHRGLYAYTAIYAPRGLNERIYHIWQLNGRVIDKVALDINGGRTAGYRSWSHKENFPENSLGHWKIRVVTEANQVIGVLRFDVVASAATTPIAPITTAVDAIRDALDAATEPSAAAEPSATTAEPPAITEEPSAKTERSSATTAESAALTAEKVLLPIMAPPTE